MSFTRAACLLALPLMLSAFDEIGPEKLTLLQDSGGWEYISMNDSDNGFPTRHTCFDGTPHPDSCSGALTFTHRNTFSQRVFIHHQAVTRHGTYKLDGDQLAFYDEFGTRDGPYTIDIDTTKKLMSMDMPQVKIRLQLYKEYRKQLDARKKTK
ncbi:MAG TPA: hypothetical protein VH477_10785 [Bryobacteraceae bacterium]